MSKNGEPAVVMKDPAQLKSKFTGAVRRHTPEEAQRFRDSVVRDGIVTPLLITGDDEIIDGFHRREVAIELKTPQVPCIVREDDTDACKALAVGCNVARRQLSNDDVRKYVDELLMLSPRESDRTLARQAGVDHKTVGKARKQLVSTGAIPDAQERTGADGRVRPAARTAPLRPKAALPGAQKSVPAATTEPRDMGDTATLAGAQAPPVASRDAGTSGIASGVNVAIEGEPNQGPTSTPTREGLCDEMDQICTKLPEYVGWLVDGWNGALRKAPETFGAKAQLRALDLKTIVDRLTRWAKQAGVLARPTSDADGT